MPTSNVFYPTNTFEQTLSPPVTQMARLELTNCVSENKKTLVLHPSNTSRGVGSLHVGHAPKGDPHHRSLCWWRGMEC